MSDSNVLGDSYNYGGISSPSAGPVYAYQQTGLNSDPSDLSEVATEFTSDEYLNIENVDATYVDVIETGSGSYIATQYRIDYDQDYRRIKKTTVNYTGGTFIKVNANPCINDTTGNEVDMRAYAWNWRTNVFDLIQTDNDNQGGGISSAIFTQRSISLDTNIRDYVNSDATTYFMLAAGPVNTLDGCMTLDELDFDVEYYPDTNAFCQSATIAPITITNAGGSNLNIDGNFSTAFSGNDTNLVLKVWQGTGSGCGTAGMGGWEKRLQRHKRTHRPRNDHVQTIQPNKRHQQWKAHQRALAGRLQPAMLLRRHQHLHAPRNLRQDIPDRRLQQLRPRSILLQDKL
ncbi:MAG: hypothetical protein IPJ89_00935 [Candidatus Iainarchaeum archaeon]|uniref:Uncharacterized protein n=1 Tax=Candidatus Iainarchaeum sp. TaxID=3101447 RepID=A0A7T9DK47_9ARCH|nr:MAG: hypothetical protein IPJ89_00935 [Candidatus Diapherotrites archaeon]